MRIAPVLVVVVACGGKGQSFQEGVQLLCDLPAHVPAPDRPYTERVLGAGKWVDEHVTNGDAKALGNVDHGLAKSQLAEAVQRAGIAHCTLLDNDMALQSFADAMTDLCAAPSLAGPQAGAYLKSHLLNPAVIQLLGSLPDLDPADRRERIDAALSRAHLTTCASLATATAPSLHVPSVTATGLARADERAPTIIANERGVVIDGKPIVALDDGKLAADDLEGGSLGLTVPHVRDYLRAVVAQTHASGLQLVVEPTLPAHTLVQLMFSAKQAGIATFGLVVLAAGNDSVLPVELQHAPAVHAVVVTPDKSPADLALPAGPVLLETNGPVTVQHLADVIAAAHGPVQLGGSTE